ncbi:pyroglutamyl-peptidase I [Arthrobacter bambusae]|jgi:pyroglutamyl-peptidase|uniref:pyroglutamyl-peptidase I n=1 Tax=Arthrobacter bambusae TaxID=1338426 RepID=UPI0027840CD5|nr:pyroglutamyl-peptidase I [Arthrobacter bambusae]MDQ0211403.1 pyroglutamyl-peptidase [Arthrobacter bambusae]MDQ0235845.1 pyroglutamyl-peptidase [Arthrobacter bambusae]
MILLTGFEPFGGDSNNPSWAAVLEAQEILRTEGHGVEALELPCVFGESATVLRDAVGRLHPELVVCVGLAGGRDRLSLERVAINCDDARIPDNAGNRPIDEPVVPEGPAAYFSTLPVKAALRALQIAGIRAEVSQTAGTYVCNHVFYALMHELAGTAAPGPRGGFIHVPYDEARIPQGSTAPGMATRDMGRGIAVVVRTALETPVDAKLSAGAIH